MSDLTDALLKAEDEVDRLRRQIAAASCREVGCDMQSYGGTNAGCGDGCNCSVPVNVCTKCGDCDYGDNKEATAIRLACSREE